MSSNMPSSFGGMSLAQLLAGSGGGLGSLGDPSSLAQLMGAGGAFAAPAGMSYLSQDPNSVNFGGLTTSPTPAPSPAPAAATPAAPAPPNYMQQLVNSGWAPVGNFGIWQSPDGTSTMNLGQNSLDQNTWANFNPVGTDPGTTNNVSPFGPSSNSLFGTTPASTPTPTPTPGPAIPTDYPQLPNWLSTDPNSANYMKTA